MAIVGGTDDEDLNNPNLPGAGAVSTGGGGGYAGDGSGQGATTKAAGTTPEATSSGNFSNLSSYLQANQGAGGTTGKAAENVVDQSGNVSNAANTTLAGNGAKEPQGAVVDQGVLGAIKGGVGSGVGGHTTATGQDGAQAAGYIGPNDATGVTGYADAAKAMDTLGGNLQNADGSMDHTSALLKQAYQQPSYSQGENSLDSFLVGGSRNEAGNTATQQAQADWNPQGANYRGILDKINGGITAAKAQTGQVQGVYDAAKTDANAQTTKNNEAWTTKDKADKQAAADKIAKDKLLIENGSVMKTLPPIAKTNVPNVSTAHAAPIYQGFKPDPHTKTGPYQGFAPAAAPAAPAGGSNPGGSNPTIDPSGTTVGQTNNPIINHAVKVGKHTLGFAHGGEVPNYDKLLKMLRK